MSKNEILVLLIITIYPYKQNKYKYEIPPTMEFKYSLKPLREKH